MKSFKKTVCACLAAVLVLSISACGDKVKKSDITSDEALNEMWNMDLDASAEKLNGFRAQTPLEVMQLWSQAKKQGNGALMYAVYSPDLKVLFLDKMKTQYGSWNLDYQPTVQDSVHQYSEVNYNPPEEVEEQNCFVSDVTLVKLDGKTYFTQIVIQLIDGGYYITSDGAEYEIQTDENGETTLTDYMGGSITTTQPIEAGQ